MLTVKKIPPVAPPPPPEDVRPWLGGFDHTDSGTNPELLAERPDPAFEGGGDDLGDESEVATLLVSDFPEVPAAFQNWQSKWMEWAAVDRRDRPAIALYQDLYRIENRTTLLPEEWDLVVATGLLSVRRPATGAQPAILVKRHVFTYQAVVERDDATGSMHGRSGLWL